MHTVSWHVVVPVKGSDAAKSRLAPVIGDARQEFASALALDTLTAAAQTPGVRLVVVSGDPVVTRAAVDLGAHVVPDERHGLGAAVTAGIAAAQRLASDDIGLDLGVAVLLGDLPALRPSDLHEALLACAAAGTAFVPDAAGTGTVLLAAPRASDLHPHFGPESAAAHARVATQLDLDLPRLRQDVDVAADLEAVLALGVGPHTAAALAGLPDLGSAANGTANGDPPATHRPSMGETTTGTGRDEEGSTRPIPVRWCG